MDENLRATHRLAKYPYVQTCDLYVRLCLEEMPSGMKFHTFFQHCRSLSFDDEIFLLDMPFDSDVASRKNGQGCTDKYGARRHECIFVFDGIILPGA